MYRHNTKHLTRWKLEKDKKPLILLGARQVGKTYLIQDFGKTEYNKQECWMTNLPLYAINTI